MKLNYNYIFTLLLVVMVAGLSINANQKTNDEPIVYSIYKGEEIKKAVKKGMKEYKNTFPKLKLEDSDFYVTFLFIIYQFFCDNLKYKNKLIFFIVISVFEHCDDFGINY